MAARHLIGVSVACAMLSHSASPIWAQQSPLHFQEATIASIHTALAAGQLTCAQLTKVMETVIARMADRGATVVRFDLPEYDALSAAVSTSQFEARTARARCTKSAPSPTLLLSLHFSKIE